MNDKNKLLIINIIKSFFISFAWMNLGSLESTSILLLCIFSASLILLQNRDRILEEIPKTAAITSNILASLFCIMFALFKSLTGGLENKVFAAVFVICTIIGLFIMFSELLTVVLTKACSLDIKKNVNNPSFSPKLFLIYSAVVFVCCLPFLALNYPAVMTTDSLNQFYQALGMEVYNNHHPWLHTALIKLFFNIGYSITGNMYAGIACYTIFQMLVVSASIGYTLECFYEMGVNRVWRTCVLIAFIILPYNLMYSVTIWKDITFSMAVLVLTVTIIRLNKAAGIRDMVLFVISALAMCVLRHNGFYAFIASMIIWLFFKRKELQKIIFISVIVIFIGWLCRGPLMKACGVEPGEYVYNMCLPLQQIGRVVAQNGDIDSTEQQWLEQVNSFDYIRAGYSTDSVDPMFAWVLDGDWQYFDSHQSDFLKTWAGIGIKNPSLYFKAFIDMAKGYWAPITPAQTIYFEMTPNELLESKPIIRGPILIKIDELLTKIPTIIPIYGFMYSMGGYFWLMLIAGAVCINRKETQKLFAFLPVLMLILTLLVASPLPADLRYAYPLMVCLPFLIMYTLGTNEK